MSGADNTAVIVDAVRTPIGRYGGVFKDIRPDDMAALVIAELIRRNRLDVNEIEDVLFGCANQAGEDNRNIARMAALIAGLPVSVAGATVNRLCASSLTAVNDACRAVICGEGEIFIAGGVESMTRAPLIMAKPEAAFPRGDTQIFDSTLGWRFVNEKLAEKYYPYSMGETAENVAQKYGITREAQDKFALQSQERYACAFAGGLFQEETVPVPLPNKKGMQEIQLCKTDEHPRPQTTMADLAKLKPAFKENGTVTAGNSSGINDGACALLIMSQAKAKSLNLCPLAKYVSASVAGVDPAYMGLGPVPATQKALARAGLSINNIDLIELNEAFAAQVIACAGDLKIDNAKLNVNGGAIALGHPLGASGARILTTLIYEMKRRGVRTGLATMCVGVGQGVATIITRDI